MIEISELGPETGGEYKKKIVKTVALLLGRLLHPPGRRRQKMDAENQTENLNKERYACGGSTEKPSMLAARKHRKYLVQHSALT